PWTLALGPGTHEIELEPGAARPLTIGLPDRTLQLVEGRATIEVTEHDAVARPHVGVAAWIAEHRRPPRIQVQSLAPSTGPLDGPDGRDGAAGLDGAAALAREAERQLAAGAREQAIASWRRLVELYPNADESHTALLDLGRLLDESG